MRVNSCILCFVDACNMRLNLRHERSREDIARGKHKMGTVLIRPSCLRDAFL